MSAIHASQAIGPASTKLVHPLIVRITHWINAVAIIMMIMSGWQIYNAFPNLGFSFPDWMTLGGWLAGAIQWHLAAMWLFVGNGLVYLAYGVVSGRFAAKFWPISPRSVVADISKALSGHLAHGDLSVYNAVQKLLYCGVILAGIVAVLSGLSIWKPVQFRIITDALGDFDMARLVHFGAMAAIVGFLVIHVAMSLLVPKSLRAMILGR